jgi:hypothetical protein
MKLLNRDTLDKVRSALESKDVYPMDFFSAELLVSNKTGEYYVHIKGSVAVRKNECGFDSYYELEGNELKKWKVLCSDIFCKFVNKQAPHR